MGVNINPNRKGTLLENIPSDKKPDFIDPITKIPVFIVPESYSLGQFVNSPDGIGEVAITPNGLKDPNILKHEFTHAMLWQDAVAKQGLSKADWTNLNFDKLYAQRKKNLTLREKPEKTWNQQTDTENIPASIYGIHGQNQSPDVQQELRSTALKFVNQEVSPPLAYQILRMAQANRLYPETTKSPGDIPIAPQKQPLSLLQGLMLMYGSPRYKNEFQQNQE